MTHEIRVEPSLTDEQEAAILALGDIWQAAHLGLSWRPKDEHIVRYVDGQFAAKVSILQHFVLIDREEVLVEGVGGVLTLPAFQGQGHAAALLNYLREYVKAPFGMLFCRTELLPFYARVGWQVVEDTVYIQQPQGTMASPLHVMSTSFGAQPWPKGTVYLNSEPW